LVTPEVARDGSMMPAGWFAGGGRWWGASGAHLYYRWARWPFRHDAL